MSDFKRNRTLDVIKGICILFVLTLHFPFSFPVAKMLGFPYWVDFAVPGFLFVSGYAGSLSLMKLAEHPMAAYYSGRNLAAKLLRLVIPFTIFFVAEQIVFRIEGIYRVGIVEYGLKALFFDYLKGGIGQGSYYFPLMIQFVLIFPLIWAVVKKKRFAGVILMLAANLIYEVMKEAFGMNEEEYRLLVFRYLFIISCGVYTALYGKEKIRALHYVLMGISVGVGAGFIFLFAYTSYEPKILTFWTTTSFPVMLYIAPLLFLVSRRDKLSFPPLEIVGKATFDIFLVQMLYYQVYEKYIALQFTEPVTYLLSLAICLAGGILFWLAESRLTGWIVRRIKNKRV